jgi:hypothetical protein
MMSGKINPPIEGNRRVASRWGGWALVIVGPLLACAPAQAASQVVGPDFSVVVTLSPQAAARLANPKETVLVAASFYGIPKAEKLRMEYQGQFPLAAEQDIELPGAGVAHFVGPHYDKSKLSAMQGDVLMVGLQIYSGRHSSPDNLLDCAPYEDSIARAAEKPIAVLCKLIGEQ